jgi:hypothetical protein
MTNLYYKLFKLSSGENIICTTDDNCDDLFSRKTICVMDPVQINNVRIPKGEYLIESYVLTSWLSFTDQPIYDISTTNIIVVSDILDSLKNNYLEFVTKSSKDNTPSDNEIEEIFNEMQKGIDENEENQPPERTRTIH